MDKKMETLSATKIKQLNKQPIIEDKVSLSEDGEWVIFKIITTSIKKRAYFDKMLRR